MDPNAFNADDGGSASQAQAFLRAGVALGPNGPIEPILAALVGHPKATFNLSLDVADCLDHAVKDGMDIAEACVLVEAILKVIRMGGVENGPTASRRSDGGNGGH